MTDDIYQNVHKSEIQEIGKEREEMIYENKDDFSIHTDFNTNTKQPLQCSGSECVRMISYRSVTVCLVLLCVLLLTAVIVLCVLINTNNQQFHIKTKNITEERDQLLNKYININKERDRLLTKYTNINEERDQLLTKYTNINEERDQLLTKYTNITEERDELLTKYTNINKERDRLLLQSKNLATENERLLTTNNNLSKQRDQLTQQKNTMLEILNKWFYYQSSLYFISSEKKSWTDSRRYCRERGADLISINNKEEQDFIEKISVEIKHWIGLSDSDEEGRWKWVDGSTLSYRTWHSEEPNGGRTENCALKHLLFWADYPCNNAFNYICEKMFKQAVK